MSFSRMLKRSGHFWEQRYYCSAFDSNDDQRVLITLCYIHANSKNAGLSTGLYYGYSHYATYADLSDDGLTEWHPAFLRLADTSDQCDARYRRFCLGYAPQPKPSGRSSNWGRIALPDVTEQEWKHIKARSPTGTGQLALPLTLPKPYQVWNSENIQKTTPVLLKTAQETARHFVRANCARLWA